MEKLMDSKYNKYLDSAIVRIALLAVGFSTWLGVSVAVLKAAAQLAVSRHGALAARCPFRSLTARRIHNS